ncbi:MAG: PRC-barrel domain-containing protein [Chloroflexota bacterium]|nr:PRC-barrel domain-containing protein [Chloroflexota bacterium]
MQMLTTQALRGRAVVSLGQDAQIGLVQDVLIDPTTNRVRGLQIHSPLARPEDILPIENVLCIRSEAVVVADRLFLQDAAATPLDTLPRGTDLAHTRIVSYTGVVLGMLRDVEFDPTGFHITRYLLNSGFWGARAAGARAFPPVPGLRLGADVLLVPDDIVRLLQAGERESTLLDLPVLFHSSKVG